ncbi:TadE/TadG family protein [Bradyrhizobium lablabi]|uniref:vWA domain-containing protein n=1 Tax=Bradyrhizobium lablabi TaxID=722472 RepID=UPI001BA7EB8A|nr:TadE/TadG family type IV pilus assembly protein [Bradyrhizobium lablabi]MBR1125029.1 TadE/TadG family protein [Bradyrhizobium lablabi]
MSGASIFSRVRTAASRFAGADQGNIAVLFAIASVPIISFVGAAIDYSRANAARTAMQAALDSTSLMLAKDLSEGLIKEADVNSKAQTYFNALFHNNDAQSVTVNASYTPQTSMGSTIVVNGSGNIKTDFMKVAGFPKLDFNTSSTSAWGNVRMRVAMALDNTGSMADDGKMPAMQKAAKSLIDQLSGLSKTTGDVYISIVPFAKDVNVGSSFVNANWIDWSEWNGDNGTSTCNTRDWRGNCTSSTWTPDDHSKWTGCVMDRAQPYDTLNTTPTSDTNTKFPAEQYSYCKPGSSAYLQPMLGLSADWTTLKKKIDDMKPTGNTNQSIGLAWAWMTLGTSDPFPAPPKDSNYQYKDAIVLLSDGKNTQNRFSSNQGQIDARQKILCDNAKAPPNNIIIYTVQIDTGGDGQQDVMKYCASSSDKYFYITSPTQTVDAFNNIGTSLSKLRVAK